MLLNRPPVINAHSLKHRAEGGLWVEIRIAVPSDEAAILALIRVAAAAIPILVEPDDR